MTNEGPEPGVKYDEPFAVAEGGGMFRCDRYPQEGGNGQKTRVEHYADGDDMPPTIIEGTYTEWGICFQTSSFSPFVISTATAGTSSGGDTGTGSGTGSASPSTGDAGIALYVGMAVSSAVGMAWVGKKD